MSSLERKVWVDSLAADAAARSAGRPVSEQEPLLASGVDSLGAVELRRALSTASGLDLPATLAFDYATLAELGTAVVRMMAEEEEEIGGGGGEGGGDGVGGGGSGSRGRDGGGGAFAAAEAKASPLSLPASSLPASSTSFFASSTSLFASSTPLPSPPALPSSPSPPHPPSTAPPLAVNPLAPTLSAAAIARGYFTSPPLRRLGRAPDAALSSVPRFTVGREGVGEVSWLGPVDVRGLGELCRLVEFAHGRVSVYAGRGGGGGGGGTDKTNLSLPPRGQGLNTPAILTLRNIWPKKKEVDAGGGVTGSSDSSSGLSSSSPLRPSSPSATASTTPASLSFVAKLRATAERAGWTHVHYDTERGVWVVKVAGF